MSEQLPDNVVELHPRYDEAVEQALTEFPEQVADFRREVDALLDSIVSGELFRG